jgi:hypothetical protein
MVKLMKSLGSLIWYVAIMVGVIYLVGAIARETGIKRAIMPQVFSDILWYKARFGGFSLIDYAKLGAFGFLCYFPSVIYCNFLSEKFFPPSIVALRADIAITKLVNEKGTRVEEDDIRCFQISPDSISIRHSARATVNWKFYQENEGAIETAVGVDFTQFIFRQGSEVIAYFQRGVSRKLADILIEQPDRPGNYFKIHGNGGSYVYVYGNYANYRECTKYKIGWAERFENIQNRGNEGERWETPYEHLLAVMEVTGRQSETAIHDQFDHARVYPKNKPGREIFYAMDDVKEWVGELIRQQTVKHDT